MSWARSAVLICLATVLAGCSGSSRSESSGEPHGLLPAGRVYHAITTSPERGAKERVMKDDEWVDVDGGRIRMVMGNGRIAT
jgi:hypothetical protein